MSQSGGGGQNASDSTVSFFWYIVLLAIGVILLWIFGKKYLVPPLFFVRNIEVHLIDWVLQGYNFFAGYVHLPLAKVGQFEHIQHFVSTAEPKKVTAEQVDYISTQIGYMYRFPVIAILLVLAYLSAFRHRSAKFVQTYSMKSLKKAEFSNWPHIAPVVASELVKKNIDEGPWAMAKLPLDFCKEYKLLAVKVVDDKKRYTIVTGAAQRQFVLQMGSLWDGVDKLPAHIKALFAAFILKLDRKKDRSVGLLEQISTSASTDRFNFTGVDDIIEQYKSHDILKWITRRHTYVYTVMSTLLEMARLEGVLATSEFLWLKPIDRRLWYVLNTVGRVTPMVEVAGVYAHWLAEKKMGRGLRTPVVDEAVTALESSVGNILYKEDDR